MNSGSVTSPAAPRLAALIACCAMATLSTPSPAAEAPALQSIVVTARRREESLQQVPAAVSVVDQALLESSYTVNTQLLSQLVPSLYYNSANPRNTAYTLRGLGSNTLSISAANDGTEPGVGFYVDQVYHGRPATAAFDFTDIARIEVLRGPQGTLFGKNTTAGAIHVVTREPAFTAAANGELSRGSDGFSQARVSVTGPLRDGVLAGRLALQLTRRDGLLTHVGTGQGLNQLDNLALRGQLLWLPGETLRIRLSADLASLDAVCCVQAPLRVGQSLRRADRQFPALAAGLGYRLPGTDVYDRLTDIDAELHTDTGEGGVALTADWQLAAGTLTSVSAWRYWDWDVANDRDYTGIPIQQVQRIPSRQEQLSQELRLASATDRALQYVAGLYWFRQRIDARPISIYGPEAAYWLLDPQAYAAPIPRDLLDGYGLRGDTRFNMDSFAAFTEVNLALTPALTATLGLRYTHEVKSGRYHSEVFGGPALDSLPAPVAAELQRARRAVLRPQDYRADNAEGSLSGRANLAYTLSDNHFVYLGYASGYKSGGLNMSGLPLDARDRPALTTAVIGDEHNLTWEAGIKSTLLGGAATLNLAAYRTRVRNYQANVVSSLETAALRSYPANIPEVSVQGGEADLLVSLGSALVLRAALAYADGANTDYPLGPCPLERQTAATLACDLSDRPLAGLSRWVGSLGFDYARPLGSGTLLLHGNSSLRSRYNTSVSASRYTWIAGHGISNARVGYRAARGWEAHLFVRNLFDADYLTAMTLQTGNSGLIFGQPGEPRLVGVTVSYRLD